MTPERWKQIEDIYLQAQQREAGSRPPFLNEACGGDEELRREVESLLRADGEAQDFLGTPAMDLAARMLAEERQPPLVGRRVGHYEIAAPIGAGGMGEVYRARDTHLDRDVAIKVLPSHLSRNAEALARFEREARAVAALSHPNILAIHDFGTEGGLCYAVTELLEGETLRNRLLRATLPWREAVGIGIAVAEGLAAAHAKGIIHRDLKPENIIVTRQGGVKILDFGLARRKAVNSARADDSANVLNLTAPGLVMGTAGYMSPEQVRGEETDAASDIFSLGCVLYEMLAGRRAFAGETTAERMAAILRDEPPRLRDTNPEVPPQLERAILRCLKKKAEERFPSAADLAADLKGMMSGAEVALPAPARTVRNIHPAFWIAAALVLLLAVGLTYWLIGSSQPTEQTRDSQTTDQTIDSIAVLPLVNASGDAELEYLSDGITEGLINSLSQLSRLRVIARPTVFRYKGREIDPIKVGGELKVRAVLTGRVILRGDMLSIQADLIEATTGDQLWGERYDRKLTDILTVQNEIARRITEKLHLRLTGDEQQRLAKRYTEYTEAYQLYLIGRFHWAKFTEEGVKKSIDYFNQALAKDPNYALAYFGLFDAYGTLGLIGHRPNEVYPEALVYAEKALAADPTLPEAHFARGVYELVYGWDWRVAEQELKRAFEPNTNVSGAHDAYGQLLSGMGRFDEAIAENKRALDYVPLSPISNANLGQVYYYARQYDQAIEQNHKVMELDPQFFFAPLYIGWAYGQQGKYPEAIAELTRARNLPGGSVPATSELGYVYAVSGQRTEAQKLLRELQERATREFVDPYYIAIVYLGLGEREQTFAWLNKAYEERSIYLVWLDVEPKFDRLRSDPRFKDLVRRVGLAL